MVGNARYVLAALLTCAAGLPQTVLAKDPKMTPAELAGRHLESLGSAEAIRKVQSRGLNCTVAATTQFGRAGAMPGRATLLSRGVRTRLGIVIDVPEYPGEHFAFDGNRVTVASLLPGVRSPLTAFIQQNGVLLREGLIGGVLTTAWPLLDLENRKPLLSYGGLKKVQGKQFHTLRYKPAKGAMAAAVTLFFDPESFRHVRTQIRLEGGGGSAATAPRLGESARPDFSRFEVVEEFGDFREEDGLQLPHTYTVRYSGDSAGNTVMATWTLTVVQVAHNPTIDDSNFVVR